MIPAHVAVRWPGSHRERWPLCRSPCAPAQSQHRLRYALSCQSATDCLFCLVHLGVTRCILVLGRAGRGNEHGIDGGARFEQQAPGRKQGVDGGHDLRGQVIDFEQAAKPQDGALVGQPAHAGVEPRKLAVQRRVVQSLFHGGVRQGEPLLHEVDAKQRLYAKGRPASLAGGRMRLD